ncbi:MAG: response regulator transcription factor [Candidatus Eremiobacterota bacterium]
MIRVLLADDVALFREMLVAALEEEEGISVVGQAADGREALERCQELDPDILILDVEMPRMNGVEATREVVARFPRTKVVILTAYEDDELIVQLIQAGATGYLLKETSMDQVVRAIRVAHTGESLIQPRVANKILRMMAQMVPPTPAQPRRDERSQQLLERLTQRETEVLIEVGKGKNNRELGEHFVISEATVKTHVQRLMQKLEMRDRTALVLFAVQAGLLDGYSA